MFGLNRYTGIKNERGKYPNIIEVKDYDYNLIAFWEDPNIAVKWKRKNLPYSSAIQIEKDIYKLDI